MNRSDKLFAILWVSVSIFAANITFAHYIDAKPMKTILIMTIEGQIDSTLTHNFVAYFQSHPKLPDYLIIQMNSPGGWSNDVALIGNALKSFERSGTMVIFIPLFVCHSGCFWLSAYADEVVFDWGTSYGFGHDVKNSTIQVNGFGNPNGIMDLYMVIGGITSNHDYSYSINFATLEANPQLGSA